MRHKKHSALAVKFKSHNHPPDQITNMEGALHTFVTPLLLVHLHGDYIYRVGPGHGMTRFPPTKDGMQQARTVIVSAQIQPDFEGPDVMLALAALEDKPLVGASLPADFKIPDVAVKQDGKNRAAYDDSLRRHVVAHLMAKGRLPALRDICVLKTSTVIGILEDYITYSSSSSGSSSVFEACGVLVSADHVLSLELLFHTAVQQLRNELSALEALCPQGYVYTSDPAAIFAREIGATILNRLQIAALYSLASKNTFKNMRAFAFNDYADAGALALLMIALKSQKHVSAVAKKDLFRGPAGTYKALKGTEGALLVVHNNGDAFGQNIETEGESGSMDGAIGVNSSAAASLKRDRADLNSSLM